MLTRQSPRTPKLCHHKATGQAYVRLSGHTFYLGAYGTEDAEKAYWSKLREWIAQGRQVVGQPAQGEPCATGPTVAQVIAGYLEFAQGYYLGRDGKESKEIGCIRDSVRPLLALYESLPAEQFSPLKLQAVRGQMIARKLARKTINCNIQRIKRIFKWACQQELVGGSVYQALAAVAGLRRGRSEAIETQPVKPVADEHVDAIQPHVSTVIWAMIQFQRLTGARSGEVVQIRGCDIDMSGAAWIYRPAEHKTQYSGHAREILIGPKAQEVVRPYLKTDLQAHLFSPRDAETARNMAKRKARATPLSPSARARRKRQRPAGDVGDRYQVTAYYNAIKRGCDRAFPLPPELAPLLIPISAKRTRQEAHAEWIARLTPEQRAQAKAWHKAHRWHPHQLRHNAATALRREFGIEIARAVLGHHSPAVTEIYAEQDRAKAASAMLKLG